MGCKLKHLNFAIQKTHNSEWAAKSETASLPRCPATRFAGRLFDLTFGLVFGLILGLILDSDTSARETIGLPLEPTASNEESGF